jgi:hypothetical protein
MHTDFEASKPYQDNPCVQCKHIVPYTGDSFDEDINLRANSLQLRKFDVVQAGFNFMKKIREDMHIRMRPLGEFRTDFQGVLVDG